MMAALNINNQDSVPRKLKELDEWISQTNSEGEWATLQTGISSVLTHKYTADFRTAFTKYYQARKRNEDETELLDEVVNKRFEASDAIKDFAEALRDAVLDAKKQRAESEEPRQ